MLRPEDAAVADNLGQAAGEVAQRARNQPEAARYEVLRQVTADAEYDQRRTDVVDGKDQAHLIGPLYPAQDDRAGDHTDQEANGVAPVRDDRSPIVADDAGGGGRRLQLAHAALAFPDSKDQS